MSFKAHKPDWWVWAAAPGHGLRPLEGPMRKPLANKRMRTLRMAYPFLLFAAHIGPANSADEVLPKQRSNT